MFADRSIYNATTELNEDFFNLFTNIVVKEKLPSYSDSELAKLDREINQVYLKQTLQRSWIKYREAWGDFAHVHYRTTSANSFRALLTKGRVSDLKDTSDAYFGTQYGDNDKSN